LVESTILRVIQGNTRYSDEVALVYLANIPGDFIVANQLVEQHYSFRIFFTKAGKSAFTPRMRREFEKRFGVSFLEARILGAYEAMAVLGLDWEGLFSVWVDWDDFLIVNGQTVKKVGDLFVVNYDIPAILHKNNTHTDIAVMILRSAQTYTEFRHMIRDIGDALIQESILTPNTPLSRAFHYSKGPFEQILDAMGFLYDESSTHVPLAEIRFYRYLLENGYDGETIAHLLRYPILKFREPDGTERESDIYAYTREDTYASARDKLKTVRCQYLLG